MRAANSFCRRSDLLGFRQNVDLPAGQLRSQAHILAAPADTQRQLFVRHHHFDAMGVLVQHHFGDFRGRQGIDDESRRFAVPRNDVDAFALQFLHHRLDAHAAHADTGADGVDGGILADHRDLGAAARIARHGADFDHAVIDFRHFLGEQAHHELGMRTRQENLRPAGFAAHVIDIGADAVAGAERFARDHLVTAHHAFGAAQIDHHRTEFGTLNHTMHDFADAVLVLVILTLALGVAHFLHDHLLGVLGIDAVEVHRRQGFGDDVTDLGVGIAAARIFQTDFGFVVLDQLDDMQITGDMSLAGFGIDIDLDVVLGAIMGLGGALHRLFHRGEHDRFVDRFVTRDGVGDLQQFKPVGGDGTCHFLSPFCAQRFCAP